MWEMEVEMMLVRCDGGWKVEKRRRNDGEKVQ